MHSKAIVDKWFDCWTTGEYHQIPITEDFEHHSPFGCIRTKEAYLKLVSENEDKFLGYKFTIHDSLYENDRACIRYTATKDDFSLDVSEWHYLKDSLIYKIVAYYHIGEIRDERKLKES